jgi:hypothetical protein
VTPAGATDRWTLADRRDFLRRSLDDADQEHEAGDLADDDYELLRRRDEARLAEVEARLAALDEAAPDAVAGPPAPPARPARRPAGGPRRYFHRPRRRWWMGVVGAAALVGGAAVLVVNLTSQRLPGQVATGGVQLSGARLVDQELDQAAVLADEGKAVTALRLYAAVLDADPHQATALAESGWLEWESGSGSGQAALERKGRTLVAEAARVDPSFYAGPLYLGTIEVQEGDAAAAVAQFERYLADHPPAGWTKDFAPEIRRAFAAAGRPLPKGVPTR